MTNPLSTRLRELLSKATPPERGNIGHGHVYPRPDGFRTRCGGPTMCNECALDFAQKSLSTDARAQIIEQLPAILTALEEAETMREALTEAESYFEERADAEYHPDRDAPVGNEEMRLLQTIRAALKEKP